jgi:hypothetical protein
MFGRLIKKDIDEENWNWKNGTGEANVTTDVLVVFSSNGTAEILNIADINEERILVYGEVEYAIPLADLKVFMGRKGRIFTYNASEENIADTKRIAALERSTVLRQITMFEKERMTPPVKLPMGKMILIGAAVFVLIIFLAVR